VSETAPVQLRRRSREERIAYFQGRVDAVAASIAGLAAELKRRRMMLRLLRKGLAVTRRMP
jgi:hypothetical protein